MFSLFEKRQMGFAALAFAIFLISLQSFTGPATKDAIECTCDAPTNGSITGQTTTAVSLEWDAVYGATGYEVKYYRTNDSYSSPIIPTSGNYIAVSELSAGSYVFYARTVCGGSTSDFVVLEDIILE